MSGIPQSTLAHEIEKIEPMTVGVLRKSLEGAADDTPVIFHMGDDAFLLKPEDWFFYTRPSEAFCITFAYPDYMSFTEKK